MTPEYTDILTSSSIALGLELVIWFTHNMIGNAVCFSIIGFFFGPVFPAILMVIAERLDDDLRGGVMGLLGSTSGAGAAALPL
jgi:fucose permease